MSPQSQLRCGRLSRLGGPCPGLDGTCKGQPAGNDTAETALGGELDSRGCPHNRAWAQVLQAVCPLSPQSTQLPGCVFIPPRLPHPQTSSSFSDWKIQLVGAPCAACSGAGRCRPLGGEGHPAALRPVPVQPGDVWHLHSTRPEARDRGSGSSSLNPSLPFRQ